MGTVVIVVYPSAEARDALTDWEEGDIVYVIGVGLTYWDGSAWQVLAVVP
jgi:hypothetical protein